MMVTRLAWCMAARVWPSSRMTTSSVASCSASSALACTLSGASLLMLRSSRCASMISRISRWMHALGISISVPRCRRRISRSALVPGRTRRFFLAMAPSAATMGVLVAAATAGFLLPAARDAAAAEGILAPASLAAEARAAVVLTMVVCFVRAMVLDSLTCRLRGVRCRWF